MDNIPINWDIISHPANWIIIVLMVWIAFIAVHQVTLFSSNDSPN